MKTTIIFVFILLASFAKSQSAPVKPNTASKEPQAVLLLMNGQPLDQSKLPQGIEISSEAIPNIATRRETPDSTHLTITYPDTEKIRSEKKAEPKSKPK